MSEEFNQIINMLSKLEKSITDIELKVKNISEQNQRIENKVDYTMNFLEEILIAESSEDSEEYEENNIYDTDESWAQDPDSWKDGDYYSEDEDEDF